MKNTALGQPQTLDIKAIAAWSKAHEYGKFEIVHAQEKPCAS